jgi:hypothetical protein
MWRGPGDAEEGVAEITGFTCTPSECEVGGHQRSVWCLREAVVDRGCDGASVLKQMCSWICLPHSVDALIQEPIFGDVHSAPRMTAPDVSGLGGIASADQKSIFSYGR